LFATQVQYENSVHATGVTFERGSATYSLARFCAQCHTHQGFLEYQATGAVAGGFDSPAPVNCRTCHQIHTTYTAADYALTATDPVTLVAGGETIDYGAAAGNLCTNCHQARAVSPVPVIDGDPVTPTSSRYGFHHGPQAQVVAGVGALEFTGSKTVNGGPTSHGDPADNAKMCATCHMASAFGKQAGGHTWKMSYGFHGDVEPHVAGCNACHDGIEDFTAFGDVPGEILDLLTQLEQRLFDLGIKRELSEDYTLHGLSVYVNEDVEYPANVAAAFLNWQLFAEDRSLGLHNPAYARSVLTNSLEALEGL
jgi:hypothetical protein